ncbi:MAG: nucleoid-associated protein [Bacteroidales bacterium]|nr:nucleoid-associated protein [Bacteroidales bacterium]
MPVFESSSIASVAVHYVGNQSTGESLILSQKRLPVDEALQDLFIQYFIKPFKGDEYFNFYHDENLSLNAVYRSVSNIFDDPESLLEESKQIARHLFGATTHANIKGGDLFVVYFSQCLFEGNTVDAVGIFKAENKDHFLKVGYADEQWGRQEADSTATAMATIDIDRGINIHKLDKGALIFNTDSEEGYAVGVVDATNRGVDAHYWRDSFLSLLQRQDQYYKTNSEMTAYKKFVTDELPQQYPDMNRVEQAELLNRSVDYFKKNDNFDVERFSQEVIAQPELIDSFQDFRQQYQESNAVVLDDAFSIDESAVKKQSRAYKSVIKLDKNFHIYVHGNSELIEQGEDDRGKFYKVYYKEES